MQRLSRFGRVQNTIVGGITELSSEYPLVETSNVLRVKRQYLKSGNFVKASDFPDFPLMNLKAEGSNWEMFDPLFDNETGLDLNTGPGINGSIIIFLNAANTSELSRDTHFTITRSIDFGKTWETKDIPLPDGFKNKSLARTSDVIFNEGRFLFCIDLYDQDNNDTLLIMFSDDNGVSWEKGYSGPEASLSFYSANSSSAMRLINDRLVLASRGSNSSSDPGGDTRYYISYSDDNGITFTSLNVPVPISGSNSLLGDRLYTTYFNSKYHSATKYGYVSTGPAMNSWSPVNIFPNEFKDKIFRNIICKYKDSIISLSQDSEGMMRIYTSPNESVWTKQFEMLVPLASSTGGIDLIGLQVYPRLSFIELEDRLILQIGGEFFMETTDGVNFGPIDLYDGVYKFGVNQGPNGSTGSTTSTLNYGINYRVNDGYMYFGLGGVFYSDNNSRGYRLLFRKKLDDLEPFRLDIGSNTDMIGIPKSKNKNLYLRIK